MGKKASNPGTISVELGRQIAHAMIDAGISTNTELANLTGISLPTVGRILNGTRDTGIEEYVLICKALGKSFIDILERTEQALEAREEN
jgi:transcriptional regulator with XRE-family HTH domain